MANVIDYSTVEEVVEVVKAERDSADYGKNRIAIYREYKAPITRNGVKLHLDICTVIIGDTRHRLIQQTGANASATTPLALVRALQALLPSLQEPRHGYQGKRLANREDGLYETKKDTERVDFVDFNTVKTIKKH